MGIQPAKTNRRTMLVLGLGGVAAMGAAGLTAWLRDAPPEVDFPEAETIDWVDLLRPEDAERAPRLADGTLARGIVQHGQMGAGALPEIAALMGGTANLDAPPRRVADAIGGLGNLRALQPRSLGPRPELDSKIIRMAGFVAPLTFEGMRIVEFLLVPYVGACIHVPPPPANQIVLVTGFRDRRSDTGWLHPVWVTGRLQVTTSDTPLAEAQYRLAGARIERFE